jgi:hypothetical protein
VVTTVESNGVLVLLVLCPVLLILLGGFGGYYDGKWKKAILAMQKKVLILTNKKCSIEVGYIPRCGKNFKQAANFCSFKQGFLVVFDIENHPSPIKRGIVLKDHSGEDFCRVNPFVRTSVQRNKLDRIAQKTPLKNPLETAKKTPLKPSPREQTAYEDSKHEDVSTKTIDIGNQNNEEDRFLQNPGTNPYKGPQTNIESMKRRSEDEEDFEKRKQSRDSMELDNNWSEDPKHK